MIAVPQLTWEAGPNPGGGGGGGGGWFWVSVTPPEYTQNALFFKISWGTCTTQTSQLADGRPITTPPPFALVWIRPWEVNSRIQKLFPFYQQCMEQLVDDTITNPKSWQHCDMMKNHQSLEKIEWLNNCKLHLISRPKIGRKVYSGGCVAYAYIKWWTNERVTSL